jgi:organic radical activating enzyme
MRYDFIVSTMSWHIKPRIARLLVKGLYLIISFICRLRYLVPGTVYISTLTIALTSKCTLNCRDCDEFIPRYRKIKRFDADAGLAITYLSNILAAVNGIVALEVIGGEPFLYKNLAEILDFAKEQSKILRIIVVTNGTLIPNEKIIHSLQNKRTVVRISDYGDLSTKKEDLVNIFKKDKIFYQKGDWTAMGFNLLTDGFKNQNRLYDENCKIYISCFSLTYADRLLIGNRIYCCAQAAHRTNLNLQSESDLEYVDLAMPKEEIRQKIKQFAFLDYAPTCDRCSFLCGCEKVPAAIQEPL